MRKFLAAATTVLTSIALFAAVPTASAAPQPPNTLAANGTYTIVNGDYLVGIAKKLNVSYFDLIAVNRITATFYLRPGNTLLVPNRTLPVAPAAAPKPAATTTTTTAPAAQPVVYTVVNGDYLVGIARKFGVPYQQVLQQNKLTFTSAIHPGTTLLLPPGSTIKVTTAPATTAPATTTPATTTAPATTTPAPTTTVAPQPPDLSAGISTGNAQLDQVLAFVRAQLNKPYAFNGAGPDTYDCSGLTMAAYAQIGIALPHQSAAQSMLGTPVNLASDAIKAGDLIFIFSTRNPTVISHVGIAISATQWINAPRTGDVVRISSMPSADKIQSVRRFVTG